MPLTRRREPFDDRAYWFELKLDRFRALAFVDHGAAGRGSVAMSDHREHGH